MQFRQLLRRLRIQRLADLLGAGRLLCVEHREDAVSELDDAQKGVRSLRLLVGRLLRLPFPAVQDLLGAFPCVDVDECGMFSLVEFPSAAVLAHVAWVLEQRLDHARRPFLSRVALDAESVQIGRHAFGGP